MKDLKEIENKAKKAPKYWVGLDISKLSINYAIMKTTDEKNLSKCKFENGKISNDLKGFADMERVLKKFPLAEIGLICETTGVYGIPFCNYFYRKNYCVVEEHARSIKHFGKTFCNRGKTDKMYAQVIC
jgi:transposase